VPSTGKRVRVVEDELMIRMLLEDMLAELGHKVAAEAAQIEDALLAIEKSEFDLAIIDVNLGGQSIAPVALALAALGRPFVFSTGYGPQGLPEGFRERPILKKPFHIDGLRAALASALAGKA
jgi:CheY-like chemotaxis protein